MEQESKEKLKRESRKHSAKVERESRECTYTEKVRE